ncbi:MAG: 3'-5' exonuclease domain-containing protein 2 [Akkermansiaceae bacterium]|jgi:ribonuclease D|nr:3'-5' exonuclease domain-containing protein 2 [Akkermansiaceae bacterium]
MNPPDITPPQKTEIAAMEPFHGLTLESVMVITDDNQAARARDELFSSAVVGFDTESKPTFRKGQKSTGPHVFQFATLERAFIFRPHLSNSTDTILELLMSARLTKVGFDLKGDLSQISRRFGVQPDAVVDLGRSFRQLGYRNTIGATTAVAMLFGRRLHKSKSITTSNWAADELSERQLLYAANDAYAAIRVFHALAEVGD